MPESEDEGYFVVIVEIGASCLQHDHRLDPLDDHVVCLDCSQVAAQAVRDGVDVDEAILAFRAWTPEAQP
jgi:hypothetical protein